MARRLAVLVVVLGVFGTTWNLVDSLDIPRTVRGLYPAESLDLEALFRAAPTSTDQRYRLYVALGDIAAGGVLLVDDVAAAHEVFASEELRWLAGLTLEERVGPPRGQGSAREPTVVVEGLLEPASGGDPLPYRLEAADGPTDVLVLLPGDDLVIVDARLLAEAP